MLLALGIGLQMKARVFERMRIRHITKPKGLHYCLLYCVSVNVCSNFSLIAEKISHGCAVKTTVL